MLTPDRRRPAARRATAGTALTQPDVAYDLVLVGGVPGAGKTTAIARATDDLPGVDAVDPEHISWWLRRRLPAGTPYRSYRWIVHLLHTIRVLAHLFHGPRAARRLVVHDPGTRVRRRGLFLAVAHLAGWRPVLLFIDVDRAVAQDGQRRRGRVVRSFDEHWESWERQRPALAAKVPGVAEASAGYAVVAERSGPVLLVDRTGAAAVLRRLCLADRA